MCMGISRGEHGNSGCQSSHIPGIDRISMASMNTSMQVMEGLQICESKSDLRLSLFNKETGATSV